MKNINEMAITNGTVEMNGTRYILTEQAHMDNDNRGEAYFTATAIKEGEVAQDGEVALYNVTWEIIDNETDAEDQACDWETPADVTDTGMVYDLATGYIH